MSLDALFDLPGVLAARRTPSGHQARTATAPAAPRDPAACKHCQRPLTDWCASVDAHPETGAWTAADRILTEALTGRNTPSTNGDDPR